MAKLILNGETPKVYVGVLENHFGGDITNGYLYKVSVSSMFKGFAEGAGRGSTSGTSMVINFENDTIEVTWKGGVYIGCCIDGNYNIKGAKKIVVHAIPTDCYAHNKRQTNKHEWGFIVGVTNVCKNGVSINDTGLNNERIAHTVIPPDDDHYNTPFTVELDVSNISGDMYPYITFHGWTVTIDRLDIIY